MKADNSLNPIQQKEIIASLNSVSFGYNQQYISFNMYEGDIIGIIGPNGAGKTILFQCILRIQNGYSGNILIFIFIQGVRNNRNNLKKIGYVPQKKSIRVGFPATVKEIVSLGIISSKLKNMTSNGKNGNNIGFSYKDIFENKIDKSIEIVVGLSNLKNIQIGELSGEEQRVLIAKALVNDPKLLILDKPTTGVNMDTQNKFYALLQKLNEENKLSIIGSSHNMDGKISLQIKLYASTKRRCFFMVIHRNFLRIPICL
jgi:zinc transport system ATP-binding protein